MNKYFRVYVKRNNELILRTKQIIFRRDAEDFINHFFNHFLEDEEISFEIKEFEENRD